MIRIIVDAAAPTRLACSHRFAVLTEIGLVECLRHYSHYLVTTNGDKGCGGMVPCNRTSEL